MTRQMPRRTSASAVDPIALGVMKGFFASQNDRMRKAGMPEAQVHVDGRGRLDTAPTRPNSIKAAQAADGVSLLWGTSHDDNGVRAYRVYRDGKLIATVKGSTWFTDRKATGAHDYEVRAVDSAGLEGPAATLPLRTRQSLPAPGEVTPAALNAGHPAPSAAPASTATAGQPATPPAAPSLTSVTEPAAGTVGLAWSAVPGAVAYGVWQDGKLIGHVREPAFTARITSASGVTVEIDAVAANGQRTPRTPAVVVRRGQQGLEIAGAPAANPASASPGAPAPSA